MSRITQKGATGPLALQSSGTFQTSTDTSLATLVGSRWDLQDGREVILVSAAAAGAVAAGKLYQNAAVVPNHQNCAVTAIQTYSNNGNTPYQLTITLGATAATANEYAGGFAIVNAGTGAGQTLRIASHPAAASAGSLVLTLEDAPNTALATSDSKISLQTPHGSNVIVQPTTVTGAAVGVGLYAIPASSYGFLTSKGLTSGLAQGAIAVGTPISASASVAGAFAQTPYSTNLVTGAVLGYASQAGVDGESRAVFVNL
jgi:hypothetical protein